MAFACVKPFVYRKQEKKTAYGCGNYYNRGYSPAVSARLKEHKLKTWCISICMRDNKFNKEIRQRSLKCAENGTNSIFNIAFELFNKHYKWAHPLRSLGVRADRLDPHEQLSLLEHEECEPSIDISGRLKKLTEKFGRLEVEQTAAIRL